MRISSPQAVINFATVSCGKPLMVRVEVKNALYAALSTVNLKIRYLYLNDNIADFKQVIRENLPLVR